MAFAATNQGFGNPFEGMFRIDPNASPEQIKKKREQIANMVNGFGRARYIGEGLGDLAGGVIAGRQGRKLDEVETRGRSEADAIFQGILSGQTGTGFNPAAPAPSAPSSGWSPFAPVGEDVVSSNPGNLPTDIIRAVDRADPQGASFTISPETRATHRPSADALNVSMDFNAVDGGGARGTEVIIPDNASPEVRAAAERYNQKVAEFAAANGIEGYPVRGVRTRSENGRGVPNTIHAEPFFNDDLDMQNAIKANPEAFAALYSDAFGNIPNARLIAPHGVGADRGATSSVFGDETTYGQTMANALLGGQAPQQAPQPTMSARNQAPAPATGPQPTQAGGLSMQDLYTAMSNPWLTDQQRAVVGTMIQQRQQEADPMRQMQLERGRLELEQMRNPQPNLTGPQREYEMARSQGFEGSFLDYKTALAEAGRAQTNINNNMGGGVDLIGTSGLAAVQNPDAPNGVEVVALPGSPAEREATAAGRASASGAVQAEQAISLIDRVMQNPDLPAVTGMIQGRIPARTQSQQDLLVEIQQLQGKAFMNAFESLKGGGQITEKEGAAAEAAMARLNRAQSVEAYSAALQELRLIFGTALGRSNAPEAQNSSVGTSSDVPTYNPQTGAWE